MSQQHTPVVQQQQAKTSSTPVAPVPLDPKVLSQVCGGTAPSAPVHVW